MKTIVPPATLEHTDNQWRIDWLHEYATLDEEFNYPEVFLINHTCYIIFL